MRGPNRPKLGLAVRLRLQVSFQDLAQALPRTRTLNGLLRRTKAKVTLRAEFQGIELETREKSRALRTAPKKKRKKQTKNS